jgi:adenylylsulfate kinase
MDEGTVATPELSSAVSPMNKQLTIAVDFDGVIADYEGWKGEATFGHPRADVIDALAVLRAEGWKIVVYSTRAAEQVRPFLFDNHVPFDEINHNSSHQTGGAKPVATVYWDDRACRYSGDARKDLEIIRSFRTWNGRR